MNRTKRRSETKRDAYKEAQFEYKCRRCGVVEHSLCSGVDLAHTLLVWVAVDGNKAQYRNSGNVHMRGVHHCEDGGVGISDLQGYREV